MDAPRGPRAGVPGAPAAGRAVTGRRKPDPAVLRHLLGQSLRLCHSANSLGSSTAV
jgi:hypothetical protein